MVLGVNMERMKAKRRRSDGLVYDMARYQADGANRGQYTTPEGSVHQQLDNSIDFLCQLIVHDDDSDTYFQWHS